MSFWVYILRCADGSYYTGHTDNLEKRIGEHETGAIASCYTFKRRPLQLVFSQDCATREEALAAEQQIKGWSRKKKEAMMRGDWTEVSRLAKSHTSDRAEPVEGPCPHSVSPEPCDAVRPEPVEGPSASSIHPSTVRQAHGSGRTEDEVAR
jgi:putative endonuclease